MYAIRSYYGNERCDLGFAMLPMRTSRYGQSKTLLSAKMIGVVPANHPLAERDVLRPEDFSGQNFVSMPPLLEARVITSYSIHYTKLYETQGALGNRAAEFDAHTVVQPDILHRIADLHRTLVGLAHVVGRGMPHLCQTLGDEHLALVGTYGCKYSYNFV